MGSLGLILATQDGGGTWQRQDAGTKETLFCLSFVDEATGWVSGANGTILHTTNAGTAWEQQRSGTANQLFAIRFLNFREGFAVGSFGTFLRTRDGGRGWEAVTLPWNILLAERIAREGLPVGRRGYLEPHLYDIFFADGTQGWMVGEFGLVLHTRDGGETWSVQPSHTSQALFQAFFASEREGWVIGQNGLLLYTNDGGENWENLQTGIAGSLFNLAFRGRFGLIVGERGTILTSVDGGVSWQRLSPNPGRSRSWLQGVSFIGGNRFAIVGDRGTILFLDLRR